MLEEAARNKLEIFSILTHPGYQINWHHRLIMEKLARVEQGKLKRLMIFMPPRHGKSQLSTVIFPAWYLGRNPKKEVITASYNSDLAQDFGSKTRDLVNDLSYKRIFKMQLQPDEKSKAKWKTSGGGTYTSVGVGGAITGRGANLFIIDDPIKNAEEAESETYRTKIWDWYRTVAYTRLEKDAAIIIILTRWHLDDLAGRLLEIEDFEGFNKNSKIQKWEVMCLPAIAENDEDYRKEGEALWPWKFDLASLEETRELLGYKNFNAIYQQKPVAADTQDFRLEYFHYFEEKDILVHRQSREFRIDITIDPAVSKSKDACNSAIVAVGKADKDPNWYILDYITGKLDPKELVDAIFKMYVDMRRMYAQAQINTYIESWAYQKALKYFVDEEMRRRKEFFNLFEFRDDKDKERRIRGLVPLYRTGVIYHRNWMKDLEKELLQFPKGKYLDLIDCLSFQLTVKRPTTQRKTWKQNAYQPISAYEGGESNRPVKNEYLII